MHDSGTYELTITLGAGALLLLGFRMAHTGAMRGYGVQIRRLLPRVRLNPVAALFAGTALGMILQSAVAVAEFAAGLAAIGAVPVAHGLLLLLGADFGSAFVVVLLAQNFHTQWPILICAGCLLHSIYRDTVSPLKHLGRICTGIAMILIAMTFMGQVSAMLVASTPIRIVISSLDNQPAIGLLLFAVVTWLARSSSAAVLFLASLAHAGIATDPTLILVSVLGINMGNALPPIVTTWKQAAVARRIAIGHLACKSIGVITGFICLRPIEWLHELLPGAPGFRVLLLHFVINGALIVLFSGIVGPIARILDRLFVEAPRAPGNTCPTCVPKEEKTDTTIGLRPVAIQLRSEHDIREEANRIRPALNEILTPGLDTWPNQSQEK